ncbi:pentapeptide repeat-containing protein [Actinoplanes sp. NPDC048796]|uniref:pentapeptide repeat-containing protein n=1 Tax=unclassified Actinoplanes TaxID=2626549 RepID=UPI0033E30C06
MRYFVRAGYLGSAALMGAALAVLLRPWRHWGPVDAFLGRHWLPLLLITSALTLFAVTLVRQWGRPRVIAPPATEPIKPLRPVPTWVVPAGALLVSGATALAILWLLHIANHAQGNAAQVAQLKVTAFRTGLTVGAGMAAGLGLLLALRRHQLAERTQQATEYDAAERRVTELYAKAAEHLGSDKAPVRLACLFALERLAQENPSQRQTVVEVVCAYLRMPCDGSEAPMPEPASAVDPREERQVRLAAQEILTRHLRPRQKGPNRTLTEDPKYWPGIELDLSGAVLHNFNLGVGNVKSAKFTGTHFAGVAHFNSTEFADFAAFGGATFDGNAFFREAVFGGKAWFQNAAFHGKVSFEDAVFQASVMFHSCVTKGEVTFTNAEVVPDAWAEYILPAGFRHDPDEGRIVAVAEAPPAVTKPRARKTRRPVTTDGDAGHETTVPATRPGS